MLHKSIRWRIQAWHSVLLACLVTGMLGAFYCYERAERVRGVDSQLQAQLTPLLPSIIPPHGFGRDRLNEPDDGPDEGPEGHRYSGPPRGHAPSANFNSRNYYFSAWRGGSELIARSASDVQVPMPARSNPGPGQFFRNRGQNRELVEFGPEGTCVVVGTSMIGVGHELGRLALVLVGVGIGLTIFGMAGGWLVAGHALRPIGEISATARQLASGKRGTRIDASETESELGQLAELLNQTFVKQEAAFEQQVRFTADASHELRTPLSVILTQVQLALSRERDGQEYRETLRICQRAAERMRTLVNSLLELARVDSGEFQLKMEECDLASMAADSLDLIAPLALERNVVLRTSVQSVKTTADSARLEQVVVNLLYNAIQHNANGVEVRLSLHRQGNEAVLQVADNGTGISPEDLPHVFERFYRADKSRGATAQGTGLGLSISQAIVQAHGGNIRAENQNGQGAIFTVCLPLAN